MSNFCSQRSSLKTNIVALATFVFCVATSQASQATTYTESVLASFQGAPGDGANPQSSLTPGPRGTFYGTTEYGGSTANTICQGFYQGCGTVFQLTNSGGKWNKTMIYTFLGAADGALPFSTLVSDSAGNLYGTTEAGPNGVTGGTVFKLTKPVAGQTQWTLTTLYVFQGIAAGQTTGDGTYPGGSIVMDSSGNIFGTTFSGGYGYSSSLHPNCYTTTGCGTVYEISPPASGTGPYTEQVLYRFREQMVFFRTVLSLTMVPSMEQPRKVEI